MAKLLTLFISGSLLISLVSGQCSIETAKAYLKRSVYEFSVELITRLGEETNNHFVTSGLSPWALVSAVSLGTEGETLQEINKVLRLHPHRCFNGKFFEIIKTVFTNTDGITLDRSSSLFIDQGMPLEVKEVFKHKVLSTGISTVETIPFNDFTNAAKTINDYVGTATRGNIDNIIEPNDFENVYLLLIDALYFKGTWQTPFPEAETENSSFYDERDNPIGDVNLMFGTVNAAVAHIRHIESTVLELPYAKSRFSMLFILPDRNVSVSKVIDNLKHVILRTILVQLPPFEQVLVQIPRFKISSDLDNMKELLTDMGLKSMFDEFSAELTGISDYRLYISEFIQKANLEVTEEGSAETAATFESIPENQFLANRPFLFMVVDKTTEIPVFLGAYSKPTIY